MILEEAFARLMALKGLGTFSLSDATGDIYLITLPQTPDECMAVATYAGVESDSRLPYDEPNVQIRVRGTKDNAPSVKARAQAVYDAIHGLGNVTLADGSIMQLAVGNQGGPIYISRDALNRHEYTVNFRTEIWRPTVNRA
jgi:minor capsid protein